jgi:hypothetical protein
MSYVSLNRRLSGLITVRALKTENSLTLAVTEPQIIGHLDSSIVTIVKQLAWFCPTYIL